MAAVTAVLEMPPDTVIPETFPVKVVLVTLPEKSSNICLQRQSLPGNPLTGATENPSYINLGRKIIRAARPYLAIEKFLKSLIVISLETNQADSFKLALLEHLDPILLEKYPINHS